MFERRPFTQDLKFLVDVADSRLRGEVGFRDHEDGASNPEQMQDVEMLLRLRHHAVVGRDGEEHQVDAVGAGEHVPDESLVARHVHDARAGVVRQSQIGGTPGRWRSPLFFFLEATKSCP